MELSGKIIAVLEKRDGIAKTTGNPWSVQSYVLETHDQYPRKMCFDVFGEDKISQFNIQTGEEVTVSFDIDAREYQGRWYNTIRAWKVERPQAQPNAGTPVPPEVPFPTVTPGDLLTEGGADDLPF
ncbi:MAG: DUF3127 domain-containing protein [Bacteroidaceae bacterium]|nr:DUF3127 domain-containing protein [Bacteroidaceae bacterium]MCF0185275.1 DUF3127 domain-containing protein [Bacteroidaceae bacterium]